MTTDQKRVLVTGAGGFVCRYMVSALLEHGHTVIANDLRFDDELIQSWATQWGNQVELIQGSVTALHGLSVDGVIHGAALTASPEDIGHTPEENFRANLDPVLHMLAWSETNCSGRVIFISSSAVYRQTAPGPVYETQLAQPLGLYAIAKQTTENLIETFHNIHGRDVCTIRLSNVYGPLEKSRETRPRMSIVGQMIHDGLHTGRIPVNPGEPARDWTYAPDIGRATCRLLEMPTLNHTLYNIAAEQVLTQAQVAEVICKYLPDVAVETAEQARNLTRQGYLSHERLESETGFTTWTPFDDGIKQIILQQREVTS